jgi:NADH-quinone oxidoreductase subunit F
MENTRPYLQNGIRHQCIVPVTTLDIEQGIRSLGAYKERARYVPDGKHGGYKAAEKVFKELDSDTIIEMVKAAGIRGKGGAGFPAGMKWSFVPKDHPGPKYLAINADEGEPGTFKDRFIMEDCPHRLIEGAMIACKAFGAHHAFCYIRGEFYESQRLLEAAVGEAYDAGILGDHPFGTDYAMHFTVHTGAGAYICGEETSMLSSLMGERGHPRMKPPFPAVEGLWRKPTIINNVETIATVPAVFDAGVDWFQDLGTERSPGIKVVSVSGCVKNPGWWEIEYGTPMDVIINELAGGLPEGRKLKAIIPGGSSCPLLRPDKISAKFDYESLQEAGSMLGSAAMIVLDDSVSVVEVMRNFSHFYSHESCGKCTPCREGTRWMLQIHDRILAGDGLVSDIDLLHDIVLGIEAKSFCPLGDAAAWPVKSAVMRFREEYEELCKQDPKATDSNDETILEEAG